MTHSFRHILTGAAAGLLCLCGPLSAAAQDVFLRPAMESFIDKDTMLEFSAQIDTFQKVRVRKNENPVFGTVIRYENEAGSCADVYIYSLDTGAKAVTREMFEKHCQETDQDIMDMPKGKPELKLPTHRIRSVIRIEAPERNAPEGGFEAHYRIQNGSTLMNSVLYLALYRGKLVKVRVSHSPEYTDETESAYRFIDAVAAMLKQESGESGKPTAQPGTETPNMQTAKTEPKPGD